MVGIVTVLANRDGGVQQMPMTVIQNRSSYIHGLIIAKG
jgi:hypothetical protein